jgi:hypothetical protein
MHTLDAQRVFLLSSSNRPFHGPRRLIGASIAFADTSHLMVDSFPQRRSCDGGQCGAVDASDGIMMALARLNRRTSSPSGRRHRSRGGLVCVDATRIM